jgi:hypothetical protein
MNGIPKQSEVTGAVQRIDATGIGPNSGELTVVIKPDDGQVVEVFAAIMPDKPDANALLGGVYASYVTIAVAALTTGRQVLCRYVQADKPRITQLSLFQ